MSKQVLSDQDFSGSSRLLNLPAPSSQGEPVRVHDLGALAGDPGVGNVLTAYLPVGAISGTRQWYSNTTAIDGETGFNYTQRVADIGKTVTCRLSNLVYAGAGIVTTGTVYLPATATSATGIFSLSKMVGTYAGAAIRVRRSSDDTEQDIGFSAQDLNAAAATTFANGSTLYVTKWYNQDGSGKDAVQTTAASQPMLQMIGPKPSIMFTGGTFLAIPTTITADRQNCTMLCVAMDMHQAVDEALFAMGVTGTIDLGYSGQPVSSNSAQAYADGSKIAVASADGSTVSTASKGIFGLVSSAASLIIHRDGKTATSAAVSSKNMVSGGFIGKGSTTGKANHFAFLFYPAALSSGDVLAVKSAVKSIHNTNDWSGAYNISIYGDSKTYAVQVPGYNITNTRLLADLYNNPSYIIRNRAISGSRLEGGTTNYATNKGIEVDGVNVLVMAKGTNDVSNVGNRTAAQLWADCQALVASARAAGYSRFVGVTLTPRQVGGSFTSAMEIERVAFNTRLIANDGGLFDAVANYNTIAALGSDGAPAYPTYFPDYLHESDAAYALEAPVLKAAIDAAIAAALKPSCTTTPTLSGSVTVGGVAACSTGTWGNSPTSFSYQWFYADILADITGENASTITIDSADTGHTLACRVTATNANGSSVTKTLASSVVTSSALGITGAPGGASQNSAYTFTPSATGGTTPYTFSIATGTLPTGLSINTSTGAITGTPTGSGNSAFTIRVTDAVGATADLATSITVTAVASYLLDSGIAAPIAAFSVTKLKNTYTGPVIRAYRDGDNAVGDVAFDAVSATPALSAASVITITSAGTSGFTVGQTMALSTFYASAVVRAGIWYGQSGAGETLSQATQANMPIIATGGALVTKNGVATIDFSGNTAYAFATSAIPGAPAGNTRTLSVVVSRESTNASTLISPSAAGGIEFIIEATQIKVQKAFGGVNALSTSPLALNTLSAALMAWDGTNYEFQIAGATVGSGTTAAQTFTGATTMKMGAGTNFVRNKVSELIIWDTALLSSGDKATLHTSQASRFSVS